MIHCCYSIAHSCNSQANKHLMIKTPKYNYPGKPHYGVSGKAHLLPPPKTFCNINTMPRRREFFPKHRGAWDFYGVRPANPANVTPALAVRLKNLSTSLLVSAYVNIPHSQHTERQQTNTSYIRGWHAQAVELTQKRRRKRTQQRERLQCYGHRGAVTKALPFWWQQPCLA